MATTPFKILVYGIVFLAIIALITNLFLFKEQNLVNEFKKQLDAAEAEPGKIFSKEVLIPEGLVIDAEKTLDSKTRIVSFSCNNAEKCTLDKMIAEFNLMKSISAQNILVSFRCIHRFELNECRIYLGTVPAQIKINSFNAPDHNIDLRKEKVSIMLGAENTGMLPAISCEAKANVFIESSENQRKEKKQYSPEKSIDLIDLNPGELKKEKIDLELLDEGKYFVNISIYCPDAGFEEKEISFNAINSIDSSKCIVSRKEESELNNKKIIDCYCEECNYAFQCQDACMKEFSTDFNAVSKEMAEAETEIAETETPNPNEPPTETPENPPTEETPPGPPATEPPQQPPTEPAETNGNLGQRIVDKAMEFIGSPYVYSGMKIPSNSFYPEWTQCFNCLREKCKEACLNGGTTCENCLSLYKTSSQWKNECSLVCSNSLDCPKQCQGAAGKKCNGKACSELGFDCSGFAAYILNLEGINFPRASAAGEYKNCATTKNCEYVSKGNFLPGDLVFFDESKNCTDEIYHVGIYNGNNQIIEARETNSGVLIGTINSRNYCGGIRFE